jgi:feruloyl esterase
MKWAYNNPQAAIEYAVRASHVTAIAGKAIVSRYYGQDPRKSYFMGCSAGGIQAMWEAQKFPWDFNGIVAGGPALRLSGIWVNWLWANRALMGKDGKPLLSKADFEVLHRAAVAKCDMSDGVKDGVIGDPQACRFDPSELRCASTKSSNCLTTPQVEAVKRIYEGPVNSKGEVITRPIALRGSELSWSDMFGGSSDAPTPGFNYLRDWLYYTIFPIKLGPEWKPENFDFDRDYKRLGAMDALEPNNPDLRTFKSSGGKLLAYTGWNDAIEGALNTADYYETAERVTGGRAATQDFFRLFVIPGMNHCSGGDGPFAVDYLSYLEAWVENGKAPDQVIGSHVRLDELMDKAMHGDQDAWHTLERRLEFPLDPANVEFSRPIYPYPIRSKYLGHGTLISPRASDRFSPKA